MLRQDNLEVLVVVDLVLTILLQDQEIHHQHHHHKEIMVEQDLQDLLAVMLEVEVEEQEQVVLPHHQLQEVPEEMEQHHLFQEHQ
jgi:hypothetical protein